MMGIVEFVQSELPPPMEAVHNNPGVVPAQKSTGQELQGVIGRCMSAFQALVDKAGLREEFGSVMLTLAEARATRVGSGVEGQPLTSLTCANIDVTRHRICQNAAVSACGRCHLVSYCGRECQKEHWPVHKQDCKSSLAEVWEPLWKREGRMPKWIGPVQNPPTPSEHLWGNTLAVSLLGPPGSEAVRRLLENGNEARLCFVASGDLRNVVETVVALPAGYVGAVHIFINDFNPKIVVRNFMLLFILSQLGESGVDLVIALWYSLAITEQQQLALSVLVRRLKEAVEGSPGAHWVFKDCQSMLVTHFEGSVWNRLLAMLAAPLSLQAATETRLAKLKNPSRRDYFDRMLGSHRPYHRVAIAEFRDFGLVLPLGALNAHHSVPNPLLLDPMFGYTMTDYADPRHGWNPQETRAAGARFSVPKNDLYGSLFSLLREKLCALLDRLSTAKVTFELFCEDARNLPSRIRKPPGAQPASARPCEGKTGDASEARGAAVKKKANKKEVGGVQGAQSAKGKTASELCLLDRVDVSNICDANYVGVSRILQDWGPMLAPGGVLVGLFMNWTGGQLPKIERGVEETSLEKVAASVRKVPEVMEMLDRQASLMNEVDLASLAFHYSKQLED